MYMYLKQINIKRTFLKIAALHSVVCARLGLNRITYKLYKTNLTKVMCKM